MAEHLILDDCPPAAKKPIQDDWRRKWPRIERLLKRFPPDQRHLRLTVRKLPQGYEARAILFLPTGTLVAQAPSNPYEQVPDYRAALDVVADRLAKEVRRHKGRIRRDDLYRRKHRRQEDLAAAVPLLEEHLRQQDRQAFRDLLRPMLRILRDHAHRELIMAQLEGRLEPGDVAIPGLLDEVVIQAWENFHRRPVDQPLDNWLVELLHQAVDQRIARRLPAESLDKPLSPEDRRYEADEGWVAENEPFWGEPEPLTLEEILPDHEIPEPWERLALEEERRRILAELQNLPRERRRAFLLHALEGWDEEEIAMLQGRSPGEVRVDIEATREFLRERLLSAA